MKKNATRIGALALSLAMAIPMAVPAWAADGDNRITASLDGAPVYNETYPEGMPVSDITLVDDLGVGVDVKVSVNGKVVSTSRPVNATGTLTDGTVWRLFEESDRSLTLSTTNDALKDDINIEITRTPIEYKVSANSGPQGFKDNLGSDSDPTCQVDVSSDTVNGNSSWQGSFWPYQGQVVKAFNIRTSAGGQNIITAGDKTITVGDTELTIRKNGGGYTIRTEHMANDLYITALTAELASQHQLSVVTVGDVTTNVVSQLMDEGETESIVLTPGNGVLDSIKIEDGGQVGTITTGKTSLTVNGHTYRVSWGSNGKATVSVPGITADVTITATSESGKAGLTIDAPDNVDCNYGSQTYPQVGDPVTVRLAPDGYAEITSVTIKSATDQVVLDGDEYRFTLDGRTYRVDSLYNGSKVIYFDAFPGNIEIEVESRETRHTITLDSDGGSDYEGYDDKLTVYDGDAIDVAFVADDPDKDIERLVFTVDGRKITVDRNDDYVVIDGRRNYIDWQDGRVEIELRNVESSMTIKSYTTDYDEDYHITVDHDGGVTTSSDDIYVNHGSTRTISFTERSGYTIEEIRVTVDDETYVAERGDNYITIDGRRCSLTWSSTRASITLNNIRNDMEVYCETDYDGYDSDYRITVDHDGGATATSDYVYADRGDSKTISFTERSGYTIEQIRVTVGSKTYTADRGDRYLTVDGRRCNLSWGSTRSSITLSNIRNDMEVYCDTDYDGSESSRPTYGDYTITLVNDRGSYYEGYGEIGVDKGDDQEVTFYAEDGCKLQRLVIDYDGRTYRASYGSSSVTIDGTRCPIDWDGRDAVTIDLRDIRDDVTVEVESDETAGSKTITRKANDGTYIDLSTNGSTVSVGKPVTVTVSPAAGYRVDSIEFRFDSSGKRAEVGPYDNSFILDGQTYSVTRGVDGSVSVRFESLPANMTVTSHGTQGTIVMPPVSGTTHVAYIAGIGNGQFAPDRAVTRAEALTMLLRATQSLDTGATTGMAQIPYLDVTPGTWYYDFVTIAYNRGYLSMLNGTTTTIFNPNEPITRAQFVEMAARVSGMVPTGPATTSFSDVLPGHWASSYIAQATGAGWIAGYPDGSFGPENTLTRAELVTIINRATGRRADVSYINSHMGRVTTFSDVGPSHWAYYDILEAANQHTFNNNGGYESWAG